MFENKPCVLEALYRIGTSGGKTMFLKVRRQRSPALLIAVQRALQLVGGKVGAASFHWEGYNVAFIPLLCAEVESSCFEVKDPCALQEKIMHPVLTQELLQAKSEN